MTRDCPTVSPDTTIEKLLNNYILPSGRHCLVVADSRVLGLVSLQNIKATPRNQWTSKTAKEVMTPYENLNWVSPNEDLTSVLKIFTEQDANQLPVVENGNIVGIVTRDNILSVFNVHNKLGM